VQEVGSIVGTLSLMALALVLTLGSVGCVIPPSLRVEDDAGVNSPPTIVMVTGDQSALAEPGPVFVARGDTSDLHIQLLDTDLADTLYVRIFVDYNMPDRLPPRVQCFAAPTMSATRTATCSVSGLCITADVGVQRNMTIVVFDRPPKDTGVDPQAMAMGGLSTYRFYFLKCQPPQT
jgi:hypothetical protein